MGTSDSRSCRTRSANSRIVISCGLPIFVGLVLIGIHQPVDALDKIRDVAKASCLPPVAVNGDGLAGQRLVYEVWQRPPVIQAHARTVGIEDAHDVGIHAMVAVIGHHHRFGKSLGFVVNAARTDRVHVSPITFRLRLMCGSP